MKPNLNVEIQPIPNCHETDALPAFGLPPLTHFPPTLAHKISKRATLRHIDLRLLSSFLRPLTPFQQCFETFLPSTTSDTFLFDLFASFFYRQTRHFDLWHCHHQ
jgi:hypothetical protein